MQPVAKGKHLYLRCVIPQDFHFLYNIREDYDDLHLWCNERITISYQEYAEQLDRQLKHTFCHFLIISTCDHGEKIGMIYCYNAHSGDGYAYTTIYLLPPWRSSVFAAEAGLLYYHYIFRFFNYRKLYSEVYSYNRASMEFLRAAGFCEEGCLKEHRYYDGAFANLHIFSIRRDDFYKRHQQLLNLIDRSDI